MKLHGANFRSARIEIDCVGCGFQAPSHAGVDPEGLPDMKHQQRTADIEILARMAARLAGRDPEEHVKLEWGEVQAFDGPMWRYHDFLMRAEQAYAVLALTGQTIHPLREGPRRDFGKDEKEIPAHSTWASNCTT